jgi:hypothetical protein
MRSIRSTVWVTMTTTTMMIVGLPSCMNEGSAREAASANSEGHEGHEGHERLEVPVPGRKYDPEHRWDLSDPIAVRKLQGTKFGEQEINEFWTRKGWHVTQKEEHYMATIAELVREGKVARVSHWGQTPFAGIYQTLVPITLEGQKIDKQTEFWMEFCENEDELNVGNPRFLRVNEYEEEHQGHADQASDSHAGERRAGRQSHASHEDKD